MIKSKTGKQKNENKDKQFTKNKKQSFQNQYICKK